MVTALASELLTIPRDEFRRERFDYRPGEHVLFGGPTQKSGKTTLAFQLLQYIATPDFPAYIAVSKPKDPVTSEWGKRLGFRLVREWPPAPSFKEAILREKPPGYLIWPKFGDLNSDVANCTRVTAALLKDRYAAGVRNKKGILVCDDTVVKSKIYGLDNEMTTIITMAGAMDLGGWFFVQKPTDSGRAAIWSYGNSEHVFLFFDGDRRNRQRYDEIGGVDPKFVENAVMNLRRHQALYIKREGYMCIVDKD
jgi:hypothetical protein